MNKSGLSLKNHFGVSKEPGPPLLKVSVSEAIALIKEVENVPAKILEYI